MKKIIAILFLSSLLILASCGSKDNDIDTDVNNIEDSTVTSEGQDLVEKTIFEGEYKVESIGNIEGFESGISGEDVLTLSRLDPDSDATQYVYVEKELWNPYNVSETIFATGSQIFFKGEVILLTADFDGHYYLAKKIEQIHEFVN